MTTAIRGIFLAECFSANCRQIQDPALARGIDVGANSAVAAIRTVQSLRALASVCRSHQSRPISSAVKITSCSGVG